MRVLIYDNKGKDVGGLWLAKLIELLENERVEYRVIEDQDLFDQESADALFVLGGDGTILFLTEFASKNSIPIIGINAGKLGFLTEFECYEMQNAVECLKAGKLCRDERATMKVTYKDKEYYALNDVFLQRIYNDENGSMIIDINVDLDGDRVSKFKGDGIIVSTPTGSTAYSLSAGGPILAPKMNAFVVTPIAAHCINHKPIVFSSRSACDVSIDGRSMAGLFIDGNYIDKMHPGDSFTINKNLHSVIFLRKEDFNFYKRLARKLNNNFDGEDYDKKR